MKRLLKNITAVGFLVLFLPYTMTLLINGRQGIHKEEELPELEYQVLSCLMREDYSWMEEGTLDLMAVLFRTECVRNKDTISTDIPPEVYEDEYSRMYEAVVRTEGQVVTIDGGYRELPYHAVSSGRTRQGALLGEEYGYVSSVDCPRDKEAEGYLRTYRISEEGLTDILGVDSLEDMELTRDDADYVTHVNVSGREWQGEAFRSLLHLPSSCFWVEQDPAGGEVRITVKGSGHGFGLSLWTADCMIRDGAEITEIIQKFYEGSLCITIP